MPATRAKVKSRSEVGAFLRDRRAKLTPADVGLVSQGERRTAGLRREELAAIAGVSVTWYTWLEQGRNVQVSREVLARIAKALRLTRAERSHLLTLVQVDDEEQAPAAARLSSSMIRMLASFESVPAYVTESACWDVLGQSRAADALYLFTARAPADRNVLRVLFGEPSLRARLLNWNDVAEDTVARFRYATASHHADPRRTALIDELSRESDDFRAIWARRDVRERVMGTKRFDIPRIGTLDFEHNAFASLERSDLSLVIYSVSDDVEATGKLRQLVGRPAARAMRRQLSAPGSGRRAPPK